MNRMKLDEAIKVLPDSPTDAAFRCAFLADDAITYYVAVHDRIFKKQNTFLSLIRNVFGRGMDFYEILHEAQSTDRLWTTVHEYANHCFNTFENGFSSDESDFFRALLPWVQAVKLTTTLLYERQKALIRKLEGNPLSVADYLRIERDYGNSVENYMRLGSLLQPRIDKLLGQDPAHGVDD